MIKPNISAMASPASNADTTGRHTARIKMIICQFSAILFDIFCLRMVRIFTVYSTAAGSGSECLRARDDHVRRCCQFTQHKIHTSAQTVLKTPNNS